MSGSDGETYDSDEPGRCKRGGADLEDFWTKAGEADIRRRVREILDVCQGGRYALGTGNSVASYVPVGNYLVMLDEGRRYAG